MVRALRMATMLIAGALALGACGTPATVIPTLSGTPSISINVPLQTVACTGLGSCLAAGANGTSLSPTSVAQVRLPSGHWTPLVAPGATYATLDASACGRSTCLIGGRNSTGDLLWSYSGQGLLPVANPAGGLGIGALSCASSTWCALLDQSSSGWRLSTGSDAGTRWSAPHVVHGLSGSAVVLSCPETGVCVAGDSSGHLVETRNAGVSWSSLAVPSDWTSLLGLACFSAIQCVALAHSGAGPVLASTTALATPTTTVAPSTSTTATSTPARSWSLRSVPGARALACSKANNCAVVGADSAGAGLVELWRGAALIDARVNYLPEPLGTVTCLGTLCVAAGTTTLVSWRP
ncbi:MAG: hypothetical protein HKL87_05495 [Acidimicrobiaceae bacterium]|nr:hypothetical protein [Acidimicrobiaceae bacterium]